MYWGLYFCCCCCCSIGFFWFCFFFSDWQNLSGKKKKEKKKRKQTRKQARIFFLWLLPKELLNSFDEMNRSNLGSDLSRFYPVRLLYASFCIYTPPEPANCMFTIIFIAGHNYSEFSKCPTLTYIHETERCRLVMIGLSCTKNRSWTPKRHPSIHPSQRQERSSLNR